MNNENGIVQSWRVEIVRDLLVLKRFLRRYAPSLLTLLFAAVLGWFIANSVSNYTHGGWELHIERQFNQTVEVNIHFHHWYYGIPLFLISLLLIQVNSTASTFMFGLGQALSAHSFLNEHGIPSIIEGGPTLAIPPEVYFPAVTALSLLYAFFLIRREEWLARASEREEVAMSYVGHASDREQVLKRVDDWAQTHFSKKRARNDTDTQILYVAWNGLDREHSGEWQFHFTVTPYSPGEILWVFHLEHIPLIGSLGLIDEWLRELDDVVKDKLDPILLHELNPGEAAAPAIPENV